MTEVTDPLLLQPKNLVDFLAIPLEIESSKVLAVGFVFKTKLLKLVEKKELNALLPNWNTIATFLNLEGYHKLDLYVIGILHFKEFRLFLICRKSQNEEKLNEILKLLKESLQNQYSNA